MATVKLRYIQIEEAVVQNKILSANDKWAYIIIKSFRNRKSKLCFPSIRKIIERSGLSKPTVLKCRTRLRELGLIDWELQTGWKKSTRYRFPLEDCSEQEIAKVLERLLMVKNETIVVGQKENLPLVKNETIHGLGEKADPEAEIAMGSEDSQMVKKETINHLNQMNKTSSMDGTASHPSPLNGSAQRVPEEPAKAPMPEILRDFCKVGKRAFHNKP